jgi:hypothetical protein
MLIMYLVSNQLSGIICVKMPFVPNGMVSGMSHRGLNGDDMQLGSLFFVVMLSNMAFRGILPKLLGTEAPRMPMEHQTPKWL